MQARFGISIPPVAAALPDVLDMTRAAEDEGLDLVAIQDHPYNAEFADTFAVIGACLAATSRISVYPGVANLPLRTPAMLGKQAATFDLLSNGRFELGIGSGAFESGVVAMGGPARKGRAALLALAEGIAIIRAEWRTGQLVSVQGTEYTVQGIEGGPAPAHRIGIWVGAMGPHALDLIGSAADGWVAPLPNWMPWEEWRPANLRIDAAARAVGRDPRSITRLAALPGAISDRALHPHPTGSDPIHGSPDEWASIIEGLARNVGFDTFVYWPPGFDVDQVQRFARYVVPAARERLRES
ncbi:LLM class flavin-dependent oxidoreductase [Nocardia yamanashiensis]|uniref:LLM class flavin-dependent oxidoreductase n=1 Tax=Nocardia yamanashiensis TaxID=209247 RepID=UPI00082AAA5C|nr:LLM class flavin-dependent oxidoreductase [Nocardia yamanashiensis]UGT40767.1 LLM class flavin-dependent oxidoreductase [Nocardia yamanashiensis]